MCRSDIKEDWPDFYLIRWVPGTQIAFVTARAIGKSPRLRRRNLSGLDLAMRERSEEPYAFPADPFLREIPLYSGSQGPSRADRVLGQKSLQSMHMQQRWLFSGYTLLPFTRTNTPMSTSQHTCDGYGIDGISCTIPDLCILRFRPMLKVRLPRYSPSGYLKSNSGITGNLPESGFRYRPDRNEHCSSLSHLSYQQVKMNSFPCTPLFPFIQDDTTDNNHEHGDSQEVLCKQVCHPLEHACDDAYRGGGSSSPVQPAEPL